VAFVFGNVAGIAATMVDCGGKRVHSLLAILFSLRLVVSSQSQLWREVGGTLGFSRGSVTFLEHQNAYVVIRVTFLAFFLLTLC
jgi:hypothetical protein